jgi:hypothetical protein
VLTCQGRGAGQRDTVTTSGTDSQFNDARREDMLEGSSAGQVGWRLAILAAWGGVAFVLALRWFRWQ